MNANTINLEPGQPTINCPKHGVHHHMISSTVPGHEGHWCQLCWLESLGKPLPVVQQYRDPLAFQGDAQQLKLQDSSVELLRISVDGITANPDVPVDEIARQVLDQMSDHIQAMVKAKTEILVNALKHIEKCDPDELSVEDLKYYAAAELIRFRS